MNIRLISLIAISLLSFCCNSKDEKKKVIAFSCIRCSGCVTTNLKYISDRKLDEHYEIVIDTNCSEKQLAILKGIRYKHMEEEDIQKRFGRFGNFILLDSIGGRTEFLSDMNLSSFIK